MQEFQKEENHLFELGLIRQLPEQLENFKQAEKALRERDEAVYLRLKERSSVKKLVTIGGLCGETGITMLNIEKIDELLTQGWSYSEGCSRDITCELAFFLHLEEVNCTEIKNLEQFNELAHFDPQYSDEIEILYYSALEKLYGIHLTKILYGGGKYKDLLATHPNCFGLPIKWKSSLGDIKTKEDILSEAIYFYIKHENMPHLDSFPISIKEIADKIQAPYHLVLKAYQYYDL